MSHGTLRVSGAYDRTLGVQPCRSVVCQSVAHGKKVPDHDRAMVWTQKRHQLCRHARCRAKKQILHKHFGGSSGKTTPGRIRLRALYALYQAYNKRETIGIPASAGMTRLRPRRKQGFWIKGMQLKSTALGSSPGCRRHSRKSGKKHWQFV